MSNLLELNKLEKLAQELGHELVIVEREGYWVITENMGDISGFGLPRVIGSTEAEAEAWLTTYLSGTAGE